MTASPFEKFVVRSPIRDDGEAPAGGERSAPLVYMSTAQVPETDTHVQLTWVYDVTRGAGDAAEQVCDHDQILVFIGMDAATPQVLGGTFEMTLGGQRISCNTTSAVFVPKGTPFRSATWKEVRRPLVEVRMIRGSGDPFGEAPIFRPAGEVAASPGDAAVDYEQYVVRSPMREAGPDYVEGRQNPTMTYMSRTQVRAARDYIEFGWIWDVPSSAIPKMRHDGFEEIVLHIGSDPRDPEALGATMQFWVGDDLLEFDTTHCAYLPRELDHGPIAWQEVRRPMIEFAMMLGAGTWAEGWENSFFDMPEGSAGRRE